VANEKIRAAQKQWQFLEKYLQSLAEISAEVKEH
jgi:hypothetical protein